MLISQNSPWRTLPASLKPVVLLEDSALIARAPTPMGTENLRAETNHYVSWTTIVLQNCRDKDARWPAAWLPPDGRTESESSRVLIYHSLRAGFHARLKSRSPCAT